MDNKQIIKRKSFKPLEWVCKSIFLNLKIYDDFTIVESKLFFDKSQISKSGNILLNGNNLNTLIKKTFTLVCLSVGISLSIKSIISFL